MKVMRIIPVILLMLVSNYGQSKNKINSKKTNNNSNSKIQFLDKISQKYRNGEMNERALWESLHSFATKEKNKTQDQEIRLLQTQATLLVKDKYYVLAAIYASKAIELSSDAYSEQVMKSWEVLKESSENAPIHNVLETLATKVKLKNEGPPSFGTDWFYFVGNALDRMNKEEGAIKAYDRVKITDKYYFPAKYHAAMSMVDLNKLDAAEESLKKILYDTSHKLSVLSFKQREEMTNMAKMALGRIYYEQKKFEQSFRIYRSVSKESVQYYDSLFEQGWAFFMAGYPNHTLGAIHSLQSPFFADRYNPEASMLKSISYFWMCKYDESKLALIEFKGNYDEAIEGLESVVSRTNLQAESAYSLFENFVLGVSSESLGIPREVIKTAVSQDSMMQVRNQYASILEEKRRLSIGGVFKSRKNIEGLTAYLENWEKHLQKAIGEIFLVELNNMKNMFDSLNEQSEFLELELLMSEKDHLLGKELHAKDKMTSVSSSKVYGWGQQSNQFWSGGKDEEYWWDEIGFYIYQVKPECNVN